MLIVQRQVREAIEETYDFDIVRQRVQGNMKIIAVMEEFESGPHMVIAFPVK